MLLNLSLFSFYSFSAEFNHQPKTDILEIKFGGWSHHSSDKDYYNNAPLNENHRGLGLEYYKKISKNNHHWFGGGVWYMKDSFDTPAYHAFASYKYRWQLDTLLDSIDFSFNFGVANRTYRDWEFVVHPNGEKEFSRYIDERETRLSAIPYLTFNFSNNFQVDMTYVPKNIAENYTNGYEIFFFRFGYSI